MLLVIKSVAMGVLGVALMWCAVLAVSIWNTHRDMQSRHEGLGAASGGFNHLIHNPVVLLLLTIGFGVGLFISARR